MSYTDKDILCGQDGNAILHSGNKYYRDLVAANKDRYLRGSPADKRNLVQFIFDTLKSKDYQFVESNEPYEKVDDETVMKKIAQRFREKDKKGQAKAKPQHVHASNSLSPPFPAAPRTHNCTNDDGFSWRTERSDDAMQRPDVGQEMIAAFLSRHARKLHVSKPDFAKQ